MVRMSMTHQSQFAGFSNTRLHRYHRFSKINISLLLILIYLLTISVRQINCSPNNDVISESFVNYSSSSSSSSSSLLCPSKSSRRKRIPVFPDNAYDDDNDTCTSITVVPSPSHQMTLSSTSDVIVGDFDVVVDRQDVGMRTVDVRASFQLVRNVRAIREEPEEYMITSLNVQPPEKSSNNSHHIAQHLNRYSWLSRKGFPDIFCLFCIPPQILIMIS